MKKKLPLVLMLAMLAFSACTDDNPTKPEPTPQDPTKIKLTATTLNQTTRAELEGDIITANWANSDKIGVYTRFKNDWSDNATYTAIDVPAEGDRAAKFTGELKWQHAALPHSFYAYYPLNDSEDLDPHAIPVTLPTTQTQNGVGNDFISKNMFMVASPSAFSAPRDFDDPSTGQEVNLEMKSLFSILEFRFASFKEEGFKVHKVTVESDNRDLTVENGTVDITKPYFDTDFARIVGGNRSSKVTLNISNPIAAPITARKSFIPSNDASKPVDLDIAFPARVVVLPNYNMDEKNPDEMEKWTVSVDCEWISSETGENYGTTVEKTLVKEYWTRTLKPGERHAITFVALTDPSLQTPPVPEDPGEAWTGNMEKPTIASNIIHITKPSELAWFANDINSYVPAQGETKAHYANHTLRIENNINLGGMAWESIGYSNKNYFAGSVDATRDGIDPNSGEEYRNLISGFVINENGTEYADQVYIGFFGYMNKADIKNLRLDGEITVNRATSVTGSLRRIGGILGTSNTAGRIENCDFSGKITANFDETHIVGGILAWGGSGTVVKECYSNAEITVYTGVSSPSSLGDVGGIGGGGASNGASYMGCWFDGKIKAEGQWRAGGIAGTLTTSGYAKACKNTGTIDVTKGAYSEIGGIAGEASGTVYACYNRANITGYGITMTNSNSGVGGIAGWVSGSIKACYNTGLIQGSSNIAKYTGNIAGIYHSTGGYNYSKIVNNYFFFEPQESDLNRELDMTAVMRFSPSNWPSITMDGWGIGDGSADNKYWNTEFPQSFGVSDEEYPQLYWEIIE